MAAKRFRLRHTFWLDVTKDDERELAERVVDLKDQRRFAQTVRDGIRLICDLRAGRTETLFALFPWLAAELPEGRGKVSLERQIEELRNLIVVQNGSVLASLDGGVTSFQSPRRAALTDGGDDVVLEVTEASGGASAQNFLNSLLNLQR